VAATRICKFLSSQEVLPGLVESKEVGLRLQKDSKAGLDSPSDLTSQIEDLL
jgi:hypothetical protein